MLSSHFSRAVTERFKHAEDLAREMPLDVYTAVVCVSGDGTVHEVRDRFWGSGRIIDHAINAGDTHIVNGTAQHCLSTLKSYHT